VIQNYDLECEDGFLQNETKQLDFLRLHAKDLGWDSADATQNVE